PPPKPHLKDLPPLREPDPPSDPVVQRGSVYSGRAVVDEPAPPPETVLPNPHIENSVTTPSSVHRHEDTPVAAGADDAGDSPEFTRLAMLATRFLELGAKADEPRGHQIAGKVYLDHGAPAEGTTIRLYHRGFGDSQRLLGEQVVAADGSYQLDYEPGEQTANLEVRVVGADGREILLGDTLFQASKRETLNLVAPTQKLAPEWDRLHADLRTHLAGGDLSQAKETTDRSDVILLREATGWDARVIALAASASTLAQDTGLEPQTLYGALRSGLPADRFQLAEIRPAQFEEALHSAAKAGVVELSTSDITRATEVFRRFATQTRRASIAPGALSSHGEMLSVAGLSDTDQDRFDDLFTEHGREPAKLWQEAARLQLPVQQLKLTGKLGFLTGNNAALTSTLVREVETPEQLGRKLAAARLYDPAAWKGRLNGIAGREGLDAVIPPAYPGETEERVEAYTKDLARKVRVAYPTQVVTQMVAARELPVGEEVATFLTRASDKGFALGRTPMSTFLREHGSTVLEGMSPQQVKAVTEQTATLQRLYQISPSDASLKVLLDAGFTSAQQVSAMSYGKFVDRYASRFESIDVARLVWRKAQQVSVVVHTFFGAAKQAQTAPPVFAVTPSAEVQQVAKDDFLKQYPTVEALFGSQDYCECDHCRSVLSPAAYLVDLLKFLDPDPVEWTGDLADWKAKHGGAPYPFPDMATWNAYRSAVTDPKSEMTPYEALTARRPDIPELQLTCENTNTVLPYIDLTNEILEFWVANGQLGPDAVHDMADELTADLLAEPQHLIPEVYDTLADARYPITLPFDLWRATVREFLNHFDAPLWRLLESAGGADEETVLLERLGLPPADQDILFAADPLATWHELYGYANAGTALTELRNAKALSRRLGVTYKQLVSLVRSNFVNPKLHTLVALRRLGIDVEDVLRYKEQPGYPPFSAEEKTEFAAHVADKGGTAWLEQTWTSGEFGKVLVLADPDAGCGFDHTTLRYADGTPADANAFLQLNFLARLWRRLGWTIEETDRALQVFRPGGETLKAALVGIARADALTAVFGSGAAARRKVLFLYSDLDDKRYRELFLTRSVLSTDAIFDHAEGQYLRWKDGAEFKPFGWDANQPENAATGNVGLAAHLGAVQAALKLTTEEAQGILNLADAPLNLTTISTLHRWSLLAKALRLKVKDLLALKELTGLDPFSAKFIETAQSLTKLSVADLDYLARHQFDPVGPYRAAAAPPLDLLRTLAAEIDRISREHADRAFTDGELRSELALVLPADVVDATMAVLAGTANQTQAGPLLTKHLVELGFLTTGQLDSLFSAPAAGLDPAALQQHADAKRTTLATAFLPYLRKKLILAAIIAELGPSSEIVLSDTLVAAFEAAATKGFDKSGNDLDGWFQVPTSGVYKFFIACTQSGTSATLRLDTLADPLLQKTTSAPDQELTAEAELKAGVFYRLTIKADQPVTLSFQGAGQPRGPITQVHPHTMVDKLWQANTYVSKMQLVAKELTLTDEELLHHLPGLSTLKVEALLAVVDYARLRDELGADPADFVELLTRSKRSLPAAADPASILDDLCERFGKIARHEQATVRAAAELVGPPLTSTVDGDRLIVTAPGFADATALRRIWDVLVLTRRLGVGVDALKRWAVPRPDFAIARDLRDTVKARYEEETWRRVAQPISDRLRQARRDALVAWIMHHHPAGFERIEQLFEYFLIDPGMEPVVHTSRLRLAISSVQTFIQRCLLNLERQAHPSALNSSHWQWMKRYRVWEANRKIFLWPENWLHPEFRDDKTHLFGALESAMLEGDITDDLAAQAFYGYLKGLEEIARLDIRSIYLQERNDPADNVVHVVGRTFTAPHKYFYR
ncbi:MAG TPA: hypothetical protein DGT23_21920, partial [Micromonosporaceae bacterium]|nr:hypothetical protein [Micromonosporaceae bacterium]